MVGEAAISVAQGSATKAVSSWKPPGYLRDNSKTLHTLIKQQVDALIRAKVAPAGYVENGNDKIPVWHIDSGGEKYTTSYTKRTVNDCVFRAVKTFIESLGLGTLTPGDKDFFTTHPRVEASGVTKANVLGVVQGLIIPWGLGITHVYVPKMSALGEQHLEFAKALGINPMGLNDYNTSNKDFFTAIGMDPFSDDADSIRAMCRFEFVDAPAGPCVVMLSSYSGTSKSGGVTVGGTWSQGSSGGLGHADFVGPRDKLAGKWQIAFSIGKTPSYIDKSINRYADLLLAFPDEGTTSLSTKKESLSLWNSIVDGKSINDWDSESRAKSPVAKAWKQQPLPAPSQLYKEEAKSPKNGRGGPVVIPGEDTRVVSTCPECSGTRVGNVDGLHYCMDCNWYKDYGDAADDDHAEDVCPMCYGPMSTDLICLDEDCGYDKAEWHESYYFVCRIHQSHLFFRREGNDNQQANYTYVCPDCMLSEDTKLRKYTSDGRTHPDKDTVQIKSFS